MPLDPNDVVFIDFETYYDQEYSLGKKYNTSEYVRDKQFLIHGVGIKEGKRDAYWVSGHDESLRACEQLGLDSRPVCAHNMAFDGFILHQHAAIHPGLYCDTLSMARATTGHHISHSLNSVASYLGLGEKLAGVLESTKGIRTLTPAHLVSLGEYCLKDVDLCAELFNFLLPYMPEKELSLVDMTIRMFCEPELEVYEDEVKAEWQREVASKQEAVDNVAADKEVFMSNDKFADLLRSMNVDPPIKISPTTGEEAYAFAKTDPGFKKLLTHSREEVRTAAETRMLLKSTINETRAERLYEAGKNAQKLPVLLNYAGAHTYRWSGGNKLNLQNLPRGGVLRRAIKAPDRHQLLVYDLSQIEARINAWFCGQFDIVAAFEYADRGLGPDVYKVMAGKFFDKPPEVVSPSERFIGKTGVLGLGYGMGWKKLQMMLKLGFLGADPIDMPSEQARELVNKFRSQNVAIANAWTRLSQDVRRMLLPNCNKQKGPITFKHKMIELPSGLALRYPGLSITYDVSTNNEVVTYDGRYGKKYIWGGLLLENIVQALARCVISDQMLMIPWKVATMTHDEVVVIVPDKEIEEANEVVHEIMITPPEWAPDLPLAAEGGYDRRYTK